MHTHTCTYTHTHTVLYVFLCFSVFLCVSARFCVLLCASLRGVSVSLCQDRWPDAVEYNIDEYIVVFGHWMPILTSVSCFLGVILSLDAQIDESIVFFGHWMPNLTNVSCFFVDFVIGCPNRRTYHDFWQLDAKIVCGCHPETPSGTLGYPAISSHFPKAAALNRVFFEWFWRHRVFFEWFLGFF